MKDKQGMAAAVPALAKITATTTTNKTDYGCGNTGGQNNGYNNSNRYGNGSGYRNTYGNQNSNRYG
jgi:hypothetical protein